MATKTLVIYSSARSEGSVTRLLADELAEGLGGPITRRDVGGGLPLVSAAWIEARDRAEAADVLATSDALIDELRDHDTLILAAPIYNFGVPAALKAWIDQVARAGETFRYTDAGPEGLLKGKRAYIVAASGGTPVESGWDHATPYLRHVLGFLGITDVVVVAADTLGNGVDKALDGARMKIAEVTQQLAA